MRLHRMVLMIMIVASIAAPAARAQDPPLVTRLLIDAQETPAGYVISATIFHEVIAELQAVGERIRAKDTDINILIEQKHALETTIVAERQAKDLVIQERVNDVLSDEGMIQTAILTPEEKAEIESVIKTVVAGKAVPIPIEIPAPTPTPTATPIIKDATQIEKSPLDGGLSK